MKIAIIGSGTWGLALAQVLNDNGHDVLLYAHDKSQCDDINLNHKNTIYYGDNVILDEKIRASGSLEEVLKDRPVVILSVPTKVTAGVLESIKQIIKEPRLFISTSKGFNPITNEPMMSLIKRIIPARKRSGVVALLGPGHAEEVILRKYTIINSVCRNKTKAQEVQKIFANSYFRVYTSDDEIGCEIAASLKNGIAIASGALDGMEQGDNAKAALISRGISEITRYGQAMGAKKETFYGLSGIGDLVVTCCSPHSRNYQCGFIIGKNRSAAGIFERNATVEGLKTIEVVYEMAQKLGIDMPIYSALYQVIYQGVKPEEMVHLLFARPLKPEGI